MLDGYELRFLTSVDAESGVRRKREQARQAKREMQEPQSKLKAYCDGCSSIFQSCVCRRMPAVGIAPVGETGRRDAAGLGPLLICPVALSGPTAALLKSRSRNDHVRENRTPLHLEIASGTSAGMYA
jgi:hypothetical protein